MKKVERDAYNQALDDAIDEIRKRWIEPGLPGRMESVLSAVRRLRKHDDED